MKSSTSPLAAVADRIEKFLAPFRIGRPNERPFPLTFPLSPGKSHKISQSGFLPSFLLCGRIAWEEGREREGHWGLSRTQIFEERGGKDPGGKKKEEEREPKTCLNIDSGKKGTEGTGWVQPAGSKYRRAG